MQTNDNKPLDAKTARDVVAEIIDQSPLRHIHGSDAQTMRRLLDLGLIERTPDGMWRATSRGRYVLTSRPC